jgi:3-dehydroquinate synthase
MEDNSAPIGAERVAVELAGRSYDIHLGSGILDAPASYEGLPAAIDCMIVTNDTVGPRFAARLERSLKERYRRVHSISLPDGESFKDWVTLNRIFDAMLATGCDRSTLVFALGGGVVGDIAGFAAACYMRGVPYVQVPTTLLAQVDSSVGGKTAVNHPLGKNMIGAFHQPVRVIADISTLDSLPQRELLAGLAEVVKYGAIADDAFLAWIESAADALLRRDERALQHAVKRSCELKAAVVALDERESGPRAILNFGHTFAHAIETGVGYGKWLHGEAVGCGMAMASDLSVRVGLIEPVHAERLQALIGRLGLPLRAPKLGHDRYVELMRADKKAVGGEMRFVLMAGPGTAVVRSVTTGLVMKTLDAFEQ